MAVDFEGEGLLDGLDGKARDARLELLGELHDDGVPLDELRRAIEEGRLALLPVERTLDGDGPRYTRDEIAERAELEVDFLRRQWRALGMPEPGDGERSFNHADLDAARQLKSMLGLGLKETDVLEIARLLGLSMSQLASANRNMAVRAFTHEDDTERDIALRYAALLRGIAPMLAPILEYVLMLHMREQIRHDVIGGAAGGEEGSEAAICFADLVGFTKLGERLEPDELGEVTERLSEMAGAVATGPVRLVKLIGDAAMLVSTRPDALVDAAIELVRCSEREGDGFPLLRAGVAWGPVITRGGDWYGHPVNVASRITGVARPGSVLATQAVQDVVDAEGYRWSYAGERRLKGVSAAVRLLRVRRAENGSQA